MLGPDGEALLLDAVFRNVEAGLCILSDVGVVLRANDLWLDSMQLTAEGAIGRTLKTLAADRAALILAAAAQHSVEDVVLPRRLRREGGVWEERLTRVGEVLLLTANAKVEPGEHSEESAERQPIADELLAANERLAVTLRSIGDAVIATDASNRITLLNAVAERLTGWSSEDALQRPLDEVFRIVCEHTGERIPSPAERVLREGVIVGIGTHTNLIARDGSHRLISDSAAPIRDGTGRVAGAVLVFRDQSLVRSAELALTRSRAELSTLIEKLPIGVFVCDREEIVYANPTFAEYCGRSPADLIGHKLEELAAPGAPGTPVEGQEWEVRGPEGRSVTLACSPVRVIEFDGKSANLWTCRDLSPMKAMQAQLIHTDRLATVGMLAAGVAHEINNPLAYVLVALELIGENLQRVAAALPAPELAEAFESLRDASAGAQRVKAIVSELKAFSRADRDEPVTLDLRTLLESAIAMATNEIKPRARLVRSFEAAPCVVGNEARLGQVFLNLLVNAAHAIPEGSVEDNEVRVVLKTDSQGRAVVEVLDTGSGIAPELLERIFAPFFTTKAGSGTGLGLAISRSTIHALGGEITVENRHGRGAIARVTLLPGRVECKSAPDTPTAPEVLRPRQVRVLVVDDEIAICSTFRRLLRGHDVTAEASARDAWARIERGERFDVIFCDVMMPGMSGMELHQRVESAVPEQAERFVFMTGGTFTQSATDFLGRVRNPCLDKPFDGRQIRQLVSQADPATAAVPGRAAGMDPSN